MMQKKVELSELQELVYAIFKDFARVCEKHNIKYSLEGGTLLGAVKYGGFVPWDDDIDIIMHRSEYNKFLKIAPKELGEDFFLQSYNNVREFPLNYAKICYNKSQIYDYDYSHLKSMNHGIFIDIFPIDNVRPEKLKNQLHIIGLLTGARKTKLNIKLTRVSKAKKIIYKIVSLLPMSVLCKLLDFECSKYNGHDTGFCYEVCNSNANFKPLSSDIYSELEYVKFKDGEYLAVKRYDEFLKSRFGENYMTELPPEDKRKPSHNQNILVEVDE